jgi:hypothetical protein
MHLCVLVTRRDHLRIGLGRGRGGRARLRHDVLCYQPRPAITEKEHAGSAGRIDIRKSMECSGDEVARAVLERFAALPAKRKPQNRGNGIKEWVPLSGIVIKGSGPRPRSPKCIYTY